MGAGDELLPLPRGITGFRRGNEPELPYLPRSEARRVVAAMFSGPITFDPSEEQPLAQSFHDVRATLRRGRTTERVRVLVNAFVPWIAFADDEPQLASTFVPIPAHACAPPAPFIVVPLSLLERPIEQAMLTRLGPAEPTRLVFGDRVGHLVFNYED